MSHNINTYNNNSFDVNSNQTVSVGTTQEYMCMRPSETQYLYAPHTNTAVRIANGRLINNLSGLTINYNPTTYHAYSYTLANAGTYLINACVAYYYEKNNNVNQSYAIWEDATGQLSNTSEHSDININYPYNALMNTVVVVESTPRTVYVRCLGASTNRIAAEDRNHPNWTSGTIEYVRSYFARNTHFTIWKLR